MSVKWIEGKIDKASTQWLQTSSVCDVLMQWMSKYSDCTTTCERAVYERVIWWGFCGSAVSLSVKWK